MKYDLDDREQAVIDAMRKAEQEALVRGRREGLNSVASIMCWVHAEPPNIEDLRKWILNQFEKAAKDMGLEPESGIFRDVEFYRNIAKEKEG